MQGSINNEARRELRLLDEIRREGREWDKCAACSGNGYILRVIHDQQALISPYKKFSCGPCDGTGQGDNSLEALEKDEPILRKIVEYTNGAYVAAYDWLKRLAEARGKSLYVATPTEQARQHPEASKLDLTMVYGGVPSLMGFGAQGKGEEKRKIAVDKFKFEDIMALEFDPLLA
jgi:hypothetical protein